MISRPRKVLLIAGAVNDGLAYQRLHLPMMELHSQGLIDVRCRSYDEVCNTDFFYTDIVVMCHSWSMMASTLVEKARYYFGKPVIQDLDDLLHDLPVDHPQYKICKQQHVAHILQGASHCVFATPYLAAVYGHLNKSHTVIENSISKRIYEDYRPVHKPHKNAFVCGWSGSQSHKPDMDTLVPGLQKFMREFTDTKAYFHLTCPAVINDEFGSRVIYEPHPVDFLDYPAVSAAYPFSVWCVPLNKNNFNEAKSDMKLLESAPNEIPLIASPRSDFSKHIDKKILLLAEDNSDYWSWYEALKWAYNNQEELAEVGKRAREYVLSERTSDKAAQKWRKVLEV